MLIGRKGSTANPYLYSGEQFDSTLNLYYLRARYYNPATGRFQTADPYEVRIQDPLTLHKYVYTVNNPVNQRDPSGRDIAENAVIRFLTHGLDHLIAEGLELTQPEVEAYVEQVVRELLAETDVAGMTLL